MAERSPRCDQLSVLRELENARRRAGRRRVPFSDEDVAVRRDEYVVRLPEIIRARATPRLAEREQQLAVMAELEDLMASRRSRAGAVARATPTTACARTIGDPHIPLTVDEDPVWREEHTSAERRHERTVRVELVNGGQARLSAAIRAASLGD